MSNTFEAEEYYEQVFRGLDLFEVEIKNKSFDRCKFVKCNFSKCDLSGSEFSDCIFDHCSISLSRFANCSFRTVKFKNTKLVGIDLTKCTINFFELGFTRCLIDTCNFSTLPMKNIPFEECLIRECTFNETNLSKATFDCCDLERTLFHHAKLEGTDFSTAKNYSINPIDNSIKGAKFSLPEAVSLLRAFDIEL